MQLIGMIKFSRLWVRYLGVESYVLRGFLKKGFFVLLDDEPILSMLSYRHSKPDFGRNTAKNLKLYSCQIWFEAGM